MIASIQHKELKLLWTKNDASRLPPDQVQKIRSILSLLNAAEKVTDMNFPGAALHPLKGDLANYWSVTVKTNRRISAEMALRLAKAFSTTPELWLNMQRDFDLWNAGQKVQVSKIKMLHKANKVRAGTMVGKR